MIRNSVCLLLYIFILLGNPLSAQKLSFNKYIIVTAEDYFNKGNEGIKKYYWIIPADSIQSLKSIFYPLFLTISKNNFDSCCNGNDIDPYVFTPADSIISLTKEYYKELEHLENIIVNKRKRIQKIIKEWPSFKSQEITTFYATAVKGYFCSSNYAITGQWRAGYKGKVFVPHSEFGLNEEFWQSANANFILHRDFSDIKFNIIK